MFFTDCTKHASAGALIHRQQTIHWIFTQTKLSSIYRHNLLSLIGPGRNVKRCLQFRRNLNLQIFFFTCRSQRLCRNRVFASVWQEEENFEVLKRCLSKYVQLAFSCVIEKLLIFYIFKIYVM